ncbi:MAG: DUF4126 domain-containing protein [Chloroflexota bacterium]
MGTELLNVTAAFGLGAAAGLNASLPLAIVALLARGGYITLAAPFDALGSDFALTALVIIGILEFAADKIEGLDSLVHALMLPVSMAAGAVLFASQTGTIAGIDPGVQIVVGLLAGGGTAGVVHLARASLRPLINVALLGPAASMTEDVASASLATTAALAPVAVPLVLLVAVGSVLLFGRSLVIVLRRGVSRLFGAQETRASHA